MPGFLLTFNIHILFYISTKPNAVNLLSHLIWKGVTALTSLGSAFKPYLRKIMPFDVGAEGLATQP